VSLYFSLWQGLWAPKNTPKDVIEKLNAAVVDSLADPALRQRFADFGQEIPPRARQAPEALGDHHKAEFANGGRSLRPQASRWSDRPFMVFWHF